MARIAVPGRLLEVMLAQFAALSKTDGESQEGQPIFGPIFETGTCQSRFRLNQTAQCIHVYTRS